MKINQMIKVRFNLSRGKNFMMWKIEYPNGDKEYLNPDEVLLVMDNALLKNYRKSAERIYNGGHKTVCAWILCETITILKPGNIKPNDEYRISYNPRVCPNWIQNGNNVDNFTFEKLISFGRSIYYNMY